MEDELGRSSERHVVASTKARSTGDGEKWVNSRTIREVKTTGHGDFLDVQNEEVGEREDTKMSSWMTGFKDNKSNLLVRENESSLTILKDIQWRGHIYLYLEGHVYEVMRNIE